MSFEILLERIGKVKFSIPYIFQGTFQNFFMESDNKNKTKVLQAGGIKLYSTGGDQLGNLVPIFVLLHIMQAVCILEYCLRFD